MRASEFPYFSDRFAALAHRGGRLRVDGVDLENTLTAINRAVELGYRYIETDVHASADGVLVAFHDGSLDRITDLVGPIAGLPWSELRRAKIGGIESLATLDELLESFPSTRFNVDLKSPRSIEPMIRTLDAHRAHDRVCVASFSIRTIRDFRRRVGRPVATAVNSAGVALYAFAPGLRRVVRPVGQAFQVPPRTWHDRLEVVTPGMIQAAHAVGRVVHVWTINERAEMERLIDLGVDGLVTDEIDVLKDLLIERGLWETEA